MPQKIKRQFGFGLIEIAIVISVILVALVSLIQLYNFFLQSSRQADRYTQAVFLAQEGSEAVRVARDESWDNISSLVLGTSYHLEQSGSPAKWILVSGQETVSDFSRRIIFESVNRDSNDNIVESGGILDPNTKKITTEVSWVEKGKNYSINLSTYLTNWRF